LPVYYDDYYKKITTEFHRENNENRREDYVISLCGTLKNTSVVLCGLIKESKINDL